MNEIKFDKKNYRKHDERNLNLIKKSLEECGTGRSIVIDNEGEIIAGNATYKQAKAANIPVKIIETDGKELIALKRTDLKTDDEKRKKLALLDNSTSDKVEWDIDNLSADFDLSNLEEFGIEGLQGFEETQAEIVEDELPEEVETKCKKGDIWQLGEHRLMCGNSTKVDDVEKLMNGEKADMVFTDPPYGMGLDTDYSKMNGNEGAGKTYAQGKVDNFTPEMISTLFACFNYVKEMFLFGADYFAELLPNKNDGCWIVWDKRENEETNATVDKRFGSMFELCWSKNKHKREIIRFMWAGMMKQKDYDEKRYHPTQKPAKLVAKFIQKYGDKLNLIVDLFGGSGSTLIACEQLNRKCYTMELDPHYCGVIIQRWENLTGKKAVLCK